MKIQGVGVTKKTVDELTRGGGAQIGRQIKPYAASDISEQRFGPVVTAGWGGTGLFC